MSTTTTVSDLPLAQLPPIVVVDAASTFDGAAPVTYWITYIGVDYSDGGRLAAHSCPTGYARPPYTVTTFVNTRDGRVIECEATMHVTLAPAFNYVLAAARHSVDATMHVGKRVDVVFDFTWALAWVAATLCLPVLLTASVIAAWQPADTTSVVRRKSSEIVDRARVLFWLATLGLISAWVVGSRLPQVVAGSPVLLSLGIAYSLALPIALWLSARRLAWARVAAVVLLLLGVVATEQYILRKGYLEPQIGVVAATIALIVLARSRGVVVHRPTLATAMPQFGASEYCSGQARPGTDDPELR